MLVGMFLLGGGQLAFAQKVLILTTNETALDAIEASNNLQTEFENTVGSANVTRLTVLSNANAISQATFTSAPGPYDIAIVASSYNPIHSTNWSVIQNAIANRWANSIVFFVDGCCEATNGNNAANMVNTLNGGAGASFLLGNNLSTITSFPLNTNSPFAPSFTGLNPFAGAYITYIDNVPANNALYLASGLPPANFPAAGTTPVDNVYGLLIPTVQSNASRGACVFAVVDASPFSDALGTSSWTANRGKIGPAFVHAATSENGACGLPRVTKSFSTTELYLGGTGNTTTLTIALSNSTPNPISGVNLTDNLPAPLQIGTNAVTNTCTGGTLTTTPGASAVGFTGFTIPSGGCSVTVPVVWPNTDTDTDTGRQACANAPTVTNTINPGVDFVSPTGQVNTPATASLTCHAAQLAVSKQIVWPANVTPVDLTGTSYPVSVVCTGTDGVVLPAIDTTITLTTPTSGSVTVTPVISSGSCVVTETSRPAPPANHIWVENPLPSATVAMAAPPTANTVQISNTLARATTDITIQKTVSGGPAAGMSGVFNFTANCGAGGTFQAAVTLNATSVGAIAITNVPQGASCTISENATLPAAPAGYAWSTNAPPAVTRVTTATGNVATFVNTLTRLTSGITIQKTVSGGPATGVSGVFNFTANCGADGTFQAAVALSAANTGSIAIANVPQGANCTISESAALPAAPADYAWGALPAAVTLVTASSGNVATFVNTLTSTAAPVPNPVPTLKEWGLMALSLFLVMMGAVQMRKRQS